jgi:hypothetical protein
LGWKITRPGRGSGLEEGDIIISLNGLALNEGLELAANVIAQFGEYDGEIVLFSLLPVAGFSIEKWEFERA